MAAAQAIRRRQRTRPFLFRFSGRSSSRGVFSRLLFRDCSVRQHHTRLALSSRATPRTPFYSVAVRTNARSILSGFERHRHTWPLHAKSNLPGKLLLVRALTRVSTQPEVVAWLIIGLSNLGGLLLYLFIRDASGDRFLAGLSAILYLFTPAKLYFVPLLNAVTPVVVLICACLMIRWLNTSRIIYAVGLGVAVYGLALFEPTALVAGVLLSALLIHRVVSGQTFIADRLPPYRHWAPGVRGDPCRNDRLVRLRSAPCVRGGRS